MFRQIEKCVCCKSVDLHIYLDLGMQPLANSYRKNRSTENEPRYPLAVQVCKNCWHSMLTVSVDPSEMFDNYLYISDTSNSLTEYFRRLSFRILNRSRVTYPNVLELATNSGLLLSMFQKEGCLCLGFDPAKNLLPLSRERELKVIPAYWSMEEASKLDRKFDVVMAIHVLPHAPDPKEFILACKKVLSEQGRIYIQTSQCNMFQNNEFDAIYHEHTSFFTARSFRKLAESCELFVTGAWKVPIHSTSFLFELGEGGAHCEEFLDMLEQEEDQGIDFFKRFAANSKEIAQQLIYTVNQIRSTRMKVVGYGAAAKGSTLLNYTGIKLDYVVDDNSMKWDYFIPGTEVPIKTPEILYQEKEPVAVVMLAWNFYDEIVSRVKQQSFQKHAFIRYFPKVEIQT